MTIVDTSGSSHELTQNVDWVGDVRTSDSKVDKTPNQVTIASRVRKRITISGTEADIELHRSLDNALITKSGTSEKVLNILLLGDIEAIGGRGNLKPKKVAERTKISHEKLIAKTGLDKGNVLRVVACDDHVINIKKKQSPTTRGCVDKERRVMCARDETSSGDHRGKTLKPGARGLLKAIERAPETTDHAIGNRVARRWLHVYLLT
jgi:hypothetical protein